MLAIMVIVDLIVCSFLSNDQSFHIYNTHFDLLPLVMLKVMEIFAASFPCQKTYLVFAALFHAVLSRFYSKVQCSFADLLKLIFLFRWYICWFICWCSRSHTDSWFFCGGLRVFFKNHPLYLPFSTSYSFLIDALFVYRTASSSVYESLSNVTTSALLSL